MQHGLHFKGILVKELDKNRYTIFICVDTKYYIYTTYILQNYIHITFKQLNTTQFRNMKTIKP